MRNFSELLQVVRGEANLTQAELAELLGVSKILISMVESGQKNPSKNLVTALSKLLNVSSFSIGPVLFSDDNFESGTMSYLEKRLAILVCRIQDELVVKQAKRLKKYAD